MTETRKIVYVALVAFAALFAVMFLLGNLSSEPYATFSTVPSAG